MSQGSVGQLMQGAMQLQAAGRMKEAEEGYRRVLVEEPGNVDAHFKLGNLLALTGRLGEAAGVFGQVCALKPESGAAHANYAAMLAEVGRLDEALAASQRAVGLLPKSPEARNNLGNVLKLLGRLEEALAAFRGAMALRPGFVEAQGNLAGVLKDLGRVAEAVAEYRKVLEQRPGDAIAHSSLIMSLNYLPGFSAQAMLREQLRWAERHAEVYQKAAVPPENDRDGRAGVEGGGGRRLRIGYLSGDFCAHVVAWNLLPLFRAHDHGRFEIFGYSNVRKPDGVTEEFKGLCDQWRDISGLNDGQAADLIRADRIDILVDLSLHSAGNRLLVLARKPAPVQMTFAGYPGGTGLRTIDYRISDPYLDPPPPLGGSDSDFVEKVVRLPHCFWCYAPTEDDGVAGLEPGPLPALMEGAKGVAFGCLNSTCKVNDEVLRLWGRVLAAVKGSRLLVLAPGGGGDFRGRVRRVLAEGGGGGVKERVEFIGRMPRLEYFKAYQRIDIALDTVPYNGHTTSLDALWMGVPVVTLAGPTVVGRAGLSQLTNLGMTELVARTADEYVGIAVGLAGDPGRLKALRESLRGRMAASHLMDGRGFAAGLEGVYREAWGKRAVGA